MKLLIMNMLFSLVLNSFIGSTLALSYDSHESCKLPFPACESLESALRCGRIPDCISIWNENEYIWNPIESETCKLCKTFNGIPTLAHSGLDMNPLSSLNRNLSCLISKNCGTYIKDLVLDSSCAECSATIDIVKTARAASHSVDEILASLCKLSSNSLACDVTQRPLLKTLINLNENGIDSNILCSSLFSDCPKEDSREEVKIFAIETSAIQKSQLPFALSRYMNSVGDQQICDDCKKLINDMKAFLEKKQTQDQIAAYLKQQICSLTPEPVKDLCNSFIDANVKTLIAELESGMDPEQICVTAGLCTTTGYSKIFNPNTIPHMETDVNMCEQCVTLFDGFQTFLPNCDLRFSNKDSFEYRACKFLTTKQDNMLQLPVLQNKTSFTQCSILGLCDAQTKLSNVLRGLTSPRHISRSLSKFKTNDQICDDCVKLVTDIETQVSKNETLNKISDKIGVEICKSCPTKYRSSCLDFVRVHLKALVDLLIVHLKPRQVCTASGLCEVGGKSDLALASTVLTTPMYSSLSLGFEQNDMSCEFCKVFVADVEENLKKNQTTQAIIDGVSDVICKELPSPYEPYCREMIAVHIPPVINLLENNLKPDQVCEAIEMCASSNKPIQLEITKKLVFMQKMTELENQLSCGRSNCDQVVSVQANVTCQECVDVLNALRDKAEEPSFNSKLKDIMINQVCPQAGFFTYECKLAVNRYWDKLVDVLKKIQPQNACGFFDLCPHLTNSNIYNPATLLTILERFALEERQKTAALKTTEDPDEIPGLCQFCEIIIHKVIEIVGGNTTAQAIETALEEVCELVPRADKAYCLEFVDKYMAKIVEALVSGATPKIACAAIGLCTPIDSDLKLLQHVTITDDKVTKPEDSKGKDNFDDCTICKMIIEYVYTKVNSTSSRDEIRENLENVCTFLPTFLQTDCKVLVDQYTNSIVDAILKDYTPEEVCKEIKMCGSSLIRVQKPAFHWPGIYSASPNDLECKECTFVVSMIYSQLKDNKTEEEIEHVLEKICAYLPGSYGAKCQKLVDDYFLTLVRLIQLSYSPEDVCKEIGFCESAPTTPKPDVSVCDECSSVVTTIYNNLGDNYTQAQITNVLDYACNYVPQQYSLVCDKLIQEYTPKLIELIMSKETPLDICKIIGLCSSGRNPDLSQNPCLPANPQEICASRTLAAKCGMLNYCQAMIWSGLGASSVDCNDEKWKNEPICARNFYNKWNEIMKEMAAAEEPITEGQLKVNDECTQGPTHWCKSIETAQACGPSAYKHCYHVVWKAAIPVDSAECRNKEWACSSETRAHECGLMNDCFSPPVPSPQMNAIPECGSAQTWCRDEETQRKCGTQEYCARVFTMPTSMEHSACLGGPALWCKNSFSAELCGKKEYCKQYTKDQENRLAQKTDILMKPGEKQQLLGAKPCSRGPGYWCQNKDTADECGMRAWCVAKSYLKLSKEDEFKPIWVKEQEGNGIDVSKPTVKAPECYFGPQFWCKSAEIAQSCGELAASFCQENIWKNEQAVNDKISEEDAEKCNRGPSYWCESKQVAKRCKAMNYCMSFVWDMESQIPSEVTTTMNVDATKASPNNTIPEGCGKGPNQWCADKETAEKCNVLKFCQTYFWMSDEPKAASKSDEQTTKAPVPEKCNLGPAYWCMSVKSARSCNELEYCTNYVWNK